LDCKVINTSLNNDQAPKDFLRGLIRDVPDFPTPGILFKDITPLLRDAEAFSLAVTEFSRVSNKFDLVAGVEARGFIFAAAVAKMTGKGFIPIRKSGKLPAISFSESYALEYGESVLQIHQDAVRSGERVMLIDDVLATGGTLGAAAKLIARSGGVVDSVAVLMEIDGLGGQKRFSESNPGLEISVLLN
jgi:adenine phosphoribosyltransferase